MGGGGDGGQASHGGSEAWCQRWTGDDEGDGGGTEGIEGVGTAVTVRAVAWAAAKVAAMVAGAMGATMGAAAIHIALSTRRSSMWCIRKQPSNPTMCPR